MNLEGTKKTQKVEFAENKKQKSRDVSWAIIQRTHQVIEDCESFLASTQWKKWVVFEAFTFTYF